MVLFELASCEEALCRGQVAQDEKMASIGYKWNGYGRPRKILESVSSLRPGRRRSCFPSSIGAADVVSLGTNDAQIALLSAGKAKYARPMTAEAPPMLPMVPEDRGRKEAF